MRGGEKMFPEIIATLNCRNRLCGKVDVKIKKINGEWAGMCPCCGAKIVVVKIKGVECEEDNDGSCT